MEGLQGAILRVKLRHLEKWTDVRRALAGKYNELLASCGLDLPAEMPWARHVYHLYTIRSEERDHLQTELLAEGIQTAVHYAVPAHLQPAYSSLGYGRESFSNAEAAAHQVLSLPLYPELSEDSVIRVSRAVQKAAARKKESAAI
jgi:dTDP-4-amino-4,6-dideoxygalactose transaminase